MANGDAIVIYIWACLKPWENESPIASLLIDPWSTWKIHCYSVFGRTQIISLYNLFLNKHIYILSYFVIYIYYITRYMLWVFQPRRPAKKQQQPNYHPLWNFLWIFFILQKRWAKNQLHRSTYGRTVSGPKRDLGENVSALKSGENLEEAQWHPRQGF